MEFRARQARCRQGAARFQRAAQAGEHQIRRVIVLARQMWRPQRQTETLVSGSAFRRSGSASRTARTQDSQCGRWSVNQTPASSEPKYLMPRRSQ
jgi:hypothetical protein